MKWWISMLLISLLPVVSHSQDTSISGIIVNAQTGKPLPQIGVYFDGTSIGTISSQDGSFRLWTKQQVNYLVVESNGFQTQRIRIDKMKNPETVINLEPNDMLQQLLPSKKRLFKKNKGDLK